MTTQNDIDWENPFKAEDFGSKKSGIIEPITRVYAANKANILFRELIAQAPTVWGFNTGSGRWLWDTDNGKKDTHSAKIVCVKEIKGDG